MATIPTPDICANHHRGNPESQAAFRKIKPHLSRLESTVYLYVSFSAGVTVKDVIRDLKLSHQTASARLAELKRDGLIYVTDQRRDRCAVVAVAKTGKGA